MSIIHLGLTQEQMRAKSGSNGNFEGPNPLCGNGSFHAEVTTTAARVSCVACLLKMNPPQRGPLTSYKVEGVAELTAAILAAGFRVFIAENGTYGFYTDAEGSRVVSFQYDLGGFKFSGNYRSKSCGTGWVMGDLTVWSKWDFEQTFANAQHAPQWATRGEQVEITTLVQKLRTYQPSSRFVEVTQ